MADMLSQLRQGDGAASAIFAGGAGVAAMGLALGVARSSSRTVMRVAQRQLTTTLEITSKDAAYPWILHWLKTQRAASRRPLRHVSVATLEDKDFELVPSPGKHWGSYKRLPLLIERAREYGTVNTSSGTPWERVTLTAPANPFARLSENEKHFFHDLLETARLECEAAREDDKTILLTCWGTEWRPFGQPRRKRPLSSVVLAEGIAENIATDIDEWTQSADWYRSRGVPYRRGYLLHGPPGGGKTSFVLAVAASFGLDVCLLSLSEDSLTDDRLALAMANVPPKALVLLEDIDAAFVSRRNFSSSEARNSSSLTLSGLLNALDGAAAAEGRLVFMTTNYIERLDDALLRPGRVDVVKKLDFADINQAAALFRQFFDLSENNNKDAARFAEGAVGALERAIGRRPSMAELQAFLIEHKHDAKAAADNAAAVADLALARNSKSNTAFDDNDDKVPETKQPTKSRGRRVLTPLEVDKLPWNPQPGWENLLTENNKD